MQSGVTTLNPSSSVVQNIPSALDLLSSITSVSFGPTIAILSLSVSTIDELPHQYTDEAPTYLVSCRLNSLERSLAMTTIAPVVSGQVYKASIVFLALYAMY